MLSMTLYLLVRLRRTSASSGLNIIGMRKEGSRGKSWMILGRVIKSCSPEKIIFKIEFLAFYLIRLKQKRKVIDFIQQDSSRAICQPKDD